MGNAPARSLRRTLKIGVSFASLAVAFAAMPAQAQTAPQAAPEPAASNDTTQIADIVVTARKKTETLQNVPISIQVLGERQLDEYRVTNFQDYAALVPSLSFQKAGASAGQIYFRGVSVDGPQTFGATAGAQPTVAIYVDEQPVTSLGRYLDLYVADLASVEALAGPQGTLYGSSSSAGTIRYVTNSPNFSHFEGEVKGKLSTTASGKPSYDINGVVNIPVVDDRIALRLVGWDDHEGGYIDNVLSTSGFAAGDSSPVTNTDLVKKDFNPRDNVGGRAKLGIKITDDWNLEGSFTKQVLKSRGVFNYNPEVGDLRVARFEPDSLKDDVNIYSATVRGKIADFDVLYAATFLDREVDYKLDYTNYAINGGGYVAYFTCAGANFTQCGDQRNQLAERTSYKRSNHEFRVSSPQDWRLRFTVGAFYENSKTDADLRFNVEGIADASLAIRPPNTYYVSQQYRVDKQTAVFGEFTFDVIPTLSATFGIRYYDASTLLRGETGSVFNPIDNDFRQSSKGEIFKGNISWKPSRDLLLYATYSEGFRIGGANREPNGPIPTTFSPDIIKNYEFGWKTTLFDRRVRWNGAVYYLDWSNVQLSTSDFNYSFLTFTSNVGNARILGAESDLVWYITPNFHLDGAVSYNDGKLRSNFSIGTNVAPEGTRLSQTPKIKWSVRGRYEQELGKGQIYGQLSANGQSGSYNDLFVNRRTYQPGFVLLNGSVGYNLAKVKFELFAENITNRRAVYSINAIDFDRRVAVPRPRTIGVGATLNF